MIYKSFTYAYPDYEVNMIFTTLKVRILKLSSSLFLLTHSHHLHSLILRTRKKKNQKTKINKHKARKKDVDNKKTLTRHVWLNRVWQALSTLEKDLKISRSF